MAVTETIIGGTELSLCPPSCSAGALLQKPDEQEKALPFTSVVHDVGALTRT